MLNKINTLQILGTSPRMTNASFADFVSSPMVRQLTHSFSYPPPIRPEQMRLRKIERKGNGLADADMALAVQQHGGGLAVGGRGVDHR